MTDPNAPESIESQVAQQPDDINTIVNNTRRIVFSDRKGLRKYQIVRAPQEMINQWKAGVDEFVAAITTKDGPKLKELMQNNGREIGDVYAVHDMITDEHLDDIDIKLLAIGLFVLREKSPWSLTRTRLKVLLGGNIKMESTFDPDGCANCYDVAAVVKELAKTYGIEGNLHGKHWEHAHFETVDGKVSDPMYGYKRGGLFQTREKFEDFKKNMAYAKRKSKKK